MVEVKSIIDSVKAKVTENVSSLNAARRVTREADVKLKMDDLNNLLIDPDNFLSYSENNLNLIHEMDSLLL